MIRIDGEILINRPVDAVFDFVADERNEPRYNPRMLRVDKLAARACSSDRVGTGRVWRSQMKMSATQRRSPWPSSSERRGGRPRA